MVSACNAPATGAKVGSPLGNLWRPWWLFRRRAHRVVPLAVERVAFKRHRRRLLVAHLDAKR
jgi:hypothetical protein